MKYIDAEKFIAEIERRLEKYDPVYTSTGRELEELLSFVTSLQQEQPGQDITEFEKALDDFGQAYATLVDRDNNPNQGIRINAYHELVKENISRILELAKEYANREQPEVDLEKEIDKYFFNFIDPNTGEKIDEKDCYLEIPQAKKLARHFYELGLNAKIAPNE